MEKRPFEILGKRIASLRKDAGWRNGVAFADKAGVAIASLRDIERGVSEGRIETRKAIADLIGCTVNDFYSEASAPKVNASNLTPEILAEFKALNKEAYKEALAESKASPTQTIEYYSTPKQELIALIQGVDDKFAGELLRYVRVKLRKPTMDQKKSTPNRS